MRFSTCRASFSIFSGSVRTTIVNLWMPASADSEVVRLSILTLRQVKTVVIWLNRPTLFSEKTVMMYSCSILSLLFEPDVRDRSAGRNHREDVFLVFDPHFEQIGARMGLHGGDGLRQAPRAARRSGIRFRWRGRSTRNRG